MTYCALIAVMLILTGCGRKMTTVKAGLVDQDSSTDVLPTSPSDECFDNGLSLFRAGQDEAAARFFAQAIEADSTNWKAHYYLGLVYKKRLTQTAAMASLHVALTHAPEHKKDRSLIYLALAELWEQQGDFSLAQLNFRTALNLYPGSTRALAGLSRVERLSQRIEK